MAERNDKQSKLRHRKDLTQPSHTMEGQQTQEERRNPAASWFSFRQDVLTWVLGMIFIVTLLGAMFGFGHLRSWDAQSGYTHNQTETSRNRFLPEPYTPEPGVSERSDATAIARWYYWQLPPSQVTVLSRLFMWLCYIGHQLTIWGTIYSAQRKKINKEIAGPKYSSKITRIQLIPLFLNMFFHILHLAQTHITYDALAQDVSEASSQGSVIMLLVVVLLMEYRDRGLAFGWPTAQHTGTISRKLRLSQGPVNIARKYHGYAFSWAAIYTFWYHPMENTWGHAFGFMHTWMLMLQGSLMYTNVHLNRLWRLILEIWVVFHGVVVATQTAGPELNGTALWPMFCFGFLWLVVMTQLFGLPIWKKLPWWTKGIPFLGYLCLCVWCYSWIPDKNGNYFVRLQEIVRIPAIEYLLVIYTWFVLEVCLRIKKKMTQKQPESEDKLTEKQLESENKAALPLSPKKETLYILCVILIYVLMVALSFLIQEFDVQLDLIALMSIFIMVFSLGAGLSFVMMESIMRPRASGKVSGKDGGVANNGMTKRNDTAPVDNNQIRLD